MIFKNEDFLEATLNPLNRKTWGRSLAICLSNNHGESLFRQRWKERKQHSLKERSPVGQAENV